MAHVDKFGLTRKDYMDAIKAASKAGQKSTDVAAKLTAMQRNSAEKEVPTARISQIMNELKKEINAAKVSDVIKQKLLAALKLKDGRGAPKADPQEKLSSLLALLDSDDEETEEVETEETDSENS